MRTIFTPMYANRAPTEHDYNLLKSEVISALDDFNRHDRIMNMFIKNSIDPIVKVYCYLRNKQENNTSLTQEEHNLYFRILELEESDIRIEQFLVKTYIPTPGLPRPTLT